MKRWIFSILLFSTVLDAAPYAKTQVRWHESADRVHYQSVCFNYVKNTTEWRHCRRDAVAVFRQLCNQATKKADRSANARDIQRRKKYCQAAASYSPL